MVVVATTGSVDGVDPGSVVGVVGGSVVVVGAAQVLRTPSLRHARSTIRRHFFALACRRPAHSPKVGGAGRPALVLRCRRGRSAEAEKRSDHDQAECAGEHLHCPMLEQGRGAAPALTDAPFPATTLGRRLFRGSKGAVSGGSRHPPSDSSRPLPMRKLNHLETQATRRVRLFRVPMAQPCLSSSSKVF